VLGVGWWVVGVEVSQSSTCLQRQSYVLKQQHGGGGFEGGLARHSPRLNERRNEYEN